MTCPCLKSVVFHVCLDLGSAGLGAASGAAGALICGMNPCLGALYGSSMANTALKVVWVARRCIACCQYEESEESQCEIFSGACCIGIGSGMVAAHWAGYPLSCVQALMLSGMCCFGVPWMATVAGVCCVCSTKYLYRGMQSVCCKERYVELIEAPREEVQKREEVSEHLSWPQDSDALAPPPPPPQATDGIGSAEKPVAPAVAPQNAWLPPLHPGKPSVLKNYRSTDEADANC